MKKPWPNIRKIALVVVSILPAVFLTVFICAISGLPRGKVLMNYRNAAASVVLSEEGTLIGKIFKENRTNISYDQIPVHLVNGLIATEDARFYEHRGVDAKSLFRVFFKSILFRKPESGGGSTISQQLAKNMFGRKRSGFVALPVYKTREALLARRLEKMFSKQEILTLYLNTIPFGENVYGIEAAALRYFNKKIGQLKVEESAVLVGMLKANSLYSPRLYPENARNRRNVVLRQMQKYGYLEPGLTDSLIRLPMKTDYSNLEAEGPAGYFVYQVKKEATRLLNEISSSTGKEWNIEEDGLIINTTLNLKLQRYANQSFRDHLSVMQKKLNRQYQSLSGKKQMMVLVEREMENQKLTEKADETDLRQIFDWEGYRYDSISLADSLSMAMQLLHAGLVALEPVTGAVRAWVGGIDFQTQPYDQVLARRQMGSTFKPVLYAAAIEEGVTPCTYLHNDSIVLTGYEEWRPGNFDHSVGGKYSLTGALVYSMNIPSFNLLLKTGFERTNALWEIMGFAYPLVNTPSLAMGTAEASILEVAVAYSAFSNGGFRVTPQKIISIQSPDGEMIWQHEPDESGDRILSAKTSLLMNAMLQRAVRDGTGSSLRSVYGVIYPVAGKTGTSQDYTDAWFAAYTPSLVIVSRVGASLPSVHFNSSANGSGSRLALPLTAITWRQVQSDPQLKNRFLKAFPALPDDLEAELACADYKESTAWEDFLEQILKGEKITFGKPDKKRESRKRSFFKRIFKPAD